MSILTRVTRNAVHVAENAEVCLSKNIRIGPTVSTVLFVVQIQFKLERNIMSHEVGTK